MMIKKSKILQEYRNTELALLVVLVVMVLIVGVFVFLQRQDSKQTPSDRAIKHGPLVDIERDLQSDVSVEKKLDNDAEKELSSESQAESEAFDKAGDGYESAF